MPKALVVTNVLAVDFEPTGKRAGDQYFNTTENVLYVYDGTQWTSSGSSSGSNILIDGGTPADNFVTSLDGGQP